MNILFVKIKVNGWISEVSDSLLMILSTHFCLNLHVKEPRAEWLYLQPSDDRFMTLEEMLSFTEEQTFDVNKGFLLFSSF